MPLHKKYIFLNNLQSKHSLLMKFGQFISNYNRKNLSKNSTKIATYKLVPGPFVIAKTSAELLLENEIFEASYIY